MDDKVLAKAVRRTCNTRENATVNQSERMQPNGG